MAKNKYGAKRDASNSDEEELTPQQILQFKEQVGYNFNEENRIRKNDFHQDELDASKVVISSQFFKLAALDLETYQNRLRTRLKPIPQEWHEDGINLSNPDKYGHFAVKYITGWSLPMNVIETTE